MSKIVAALYADVIGMTVANAFANSPMHRRSSPGTRGKPGACRCPSCRRSAASRPAHARSAPWRRDLRADPVDLLPAMQPERAARKARDADG
jgi:hypothetical protein